MAVPHRFDQSEHITVLHLSDPHATVDEALYGRVDGLERLRAAAEYAASAGLTPELVAVSGDLAQAGHWSAYERLAEEFDRLERLFGAPVVAAVGNHDDPEAFERVFGARRPRNGVVELPEARAIVLDTSRGCLDPGQLDWLDAVLAQPHPFGSVIVMHHPPLPSPLPALAARGLARPEELARVIAGRDVRAILAGHYHHPMSGQFAGVPVWAAPSLAYQQIMNAGPDSVSGEDSGMFSIVKVTADSLVAVPVTLDEPAPLFTVPAGCATTVPDRPRTDRTTTDRTTL